MTIKDSNIEHFKDALQREGLRLTSQRIAILEDILASEEHRECDDILFSLRRKQFSVSRATVYRTLEILEKGGFVRKMNIGDGRFRYENKLPKPHHDHMICLECGRIIEFVDQEIEARQVHLTKQHNFKLVRHIHQLFGICEDCHPVAANKGV